MPFTAWCKVCKQDVTHQVKIDSKGIHNEHIHPDVEINFDIPTNLRVPMIEEKIDSLSMRVDKLDRKVDSMRNLVSNMVDILSILSERTGRGVTEISGIIEKIKKKEA